MAHDIRDIQTWYDSIRDRHVPKVITGIRGTRKSLFLEELYNRFRARGIPRKRILLLDSESPEFRRCATGAEVVAGLRARIPTDGHVHLLFKEVAGLPDPEFVLASLIRNPDWDIIATSSSRHIVSGSLKSIYHVDVEAFDVLPPAELHTCSGDAARARWNEILVKDVLSNTRVVEVPVINRLAGWLSDNLGDMISLRLISNAISSRHRAISPHTIGTFLDMLVDANIIRKAVRWCTQEDAPLGTGYRYFFTDPDLRLAQFGPAPYGERRRMALNRAWLWLSHAEPEVFSSSGSPEVDFVTRNGKNRVYWHVDVDGDGAVVRMV